MSNYPNFLVFSDDWGIHPSSCQHIFRRIAQNHKVLWVNTIGMRNPTFTIRDMKKIKDKILRMLRSKQKGKAIPAPNNITVCQPFMLPFSNISFIRKWNQYSVISMVRAYLHKLKISNPILVSTVPNACDYAGFFNEKRIVYYCVDDFSEWPGFNKDLVQAMESELISKADILIATSHKLFDYLKSFHRPLYLLPHGVDLEFFSSLPAEEHPKLRNIPRPRVGYYGLFDERSDVDLLKKVARSLPNVSFVITGPTEIDITPLEKIRNFYFTGSVPYNELPAILAGWNICMMPYKVNELTNAIQPLKLKEYLATGKPVISTPIAEANKLARFIAIGKTPQEWTMAIETLLTKGMDKNRNELARWLKSEDWNNKAKTFLRYIVS